MPDFKWIDELVESVTAHLRQAESIALDEAVARAYRRDVPKLLAAIGALSSLRDAEPDWEYGARRDVLHAQEPASVRPTLAQAREAADWYTPLDGVPATLLRRTPEVPAGPWLPVPEGNQ